MRDPRLLEASHEVDLSYGNDFLTTLDDFRQNCFEWLVLNTVSMQVVDVPEDCENTQFAGLDRISVST